jgi:hypothetical protein
MKKLKVCYHGNCFDGASSAAVFSRFYQERINAGWEMAYQPMMHRAGALFDESAFDGDENAIVDFKYCNSDKLTWWFDHHKSAFLTAEDEAHFRADTNGKKFVDASYKSCTKFIADVAAQKFGFDAAPMSELIHWANIIDGALYKNAAEPVEMKADAFKLGLVIENTRDPQVIQQIIIDLQHRTLSEVAALPYVVERIEPLYERHLRSMEIIKQAARVAGPRREAEEFGLELAAICERYGGGGHAVVAAISLAPEELETARKIAADVVEELQK